MYFYLLHIDRSMVWNVRLFDFCCVCGSDGLLVLCPGEICVLYLELMLVAVGVEKNDFTLGRFVDMSVGSFDAGSEVYVVTI